MDVVAAKIYSYAGGEFNLNSPEAAFRNTFDNLHLKTKRFMAGVFSTKIEVLESLEEEQI